MTVVSVLRALTSNFKDPLCIDFKKIQDSFKTRFFSFNLIGMSNPLEMKSINMLIFINY